MCVNFFQRGSFSTFKSYDVRDLQTKIANYSGCFYLFLFPFKKIKKGLGSATVPICLLRKMNIDSIHLSMAIV